MQLRLPKFLRGLLVAAPLFAPACFPAGLFAADPNAASLKDPLYVQQLRASLVAGRGGEKVYYTQRFDLDRLPPYRPGSFPSGTLHVWGLSYLGDSMLAKYWKAGFERVQPGIKLDFRLPIAALGFAGLYTGTADICAGTPINFYEMRTFHRVFSHDPLEIPMVTGSFNVGGWAEAIAIFVNKDNPLTQITLEQLDGVFGAARLGGWKGDTWHPEYARGSDRDIRTWGQLGLTGEWAGHEIKPYGGVVQFGTADKFSDAVLRGSQKWKEKTRMYANTSKPDGTWDGWQTQMARDLSKDRYGIAYMGYLNKTPDMKLVSVQARPGGPFIAPSWETVQKREYPLFQETLWYVNRAPGTPLDPKVREFLTYVLSRDGQEEVAHDGKYTPLNAELDRVALKRLE